MQILLKSSQTKTQMRSVTVRFITLLWGCFLLSFLIFICMYVFFTIQSFKASEVNKMLVIPGIIISASRSRPKATAIHIRCKGCNNSKTIACGVAFGGAQLPRTCDAPRTEGEDQCPLDP